MDTAQLQLKLHAEKLGRLLDQAVKEARNEAERVEHFMKRFHQCCDVCIEVMYSQDVPSSLRKLAEAAVYPSDDD